VQAVQFAHIKKKHIRFFWERFKSVGGDETGKITGEDYGALLLEPQTLYMIKLADTFQGNACTNTCKSSKRHREALMLMSFSEFVRSVISYSMMDNEQLIKFAFSLYDHADDQRITEKDMLALVQLLWGEHIGEGDAEGAIEDGTINKTLDMILHEGNAYVSWQKFRQLDREFPRLLYPIYRIRQSMQVGETRVTRLESLTRPSHATHTDSLLPRRPPSSARRSGTPARPSPWRTGPCCSPG
jgi:Ca2+-binding EF-hand superfamily protein